MAATATVGGGKLRLRPGGLNRWLLGAGAIVVLGGAGTLYATSRPSKVAIPASDLYKVGYSNVTQTITGAGTIQAPQQISLSFSQGSGLSAGNEIVTAIDAKINQHVKAGQVLAQISDASLLPKVQAAQASLASAQASLQKVEQPATPQAIAVAQASVQRAQITLQGAQQQYQTALAIYQDPVTSEQTLVSAQNSVNQDLAALSSAKAGVAAAQVKLQEAQSGAATSSANSLPTTIQSDQKALSAAKAQLKVDQATLANAQTNLQHDQHQLSTDESLYSSLAAQYPAAEKAYQTALANYNSWQGYGSNPYSTELSATQTAASQAQSAYNTLQTAKTQVQSDNTSVLSAQKAVTADQASIQSAQANLTSAQTQLAGISASNPLSVKSAEVALQQAQASLKQSETAYQGAVASEKVAKAVAADKNSQLQTLNQAKNTVALDQNGVTQAQANLAETEAPPTAAAIAGAKASVQSAQATLTSAQAAEADTKLVAPISGIIVQSNYQPGDTISSATPVFLLDDSVKSNLQVSVNVPEADIGQVHAGQVVAITASAFPGQTFKGSVIQVDPSPQVISNVTEYTVLTTVQNPTGKLLPGMSANVAITTASASHVVAVPAVAIQNLGSLTGVYVKGTRPAGLGPHRKGKAAHGKHPRFATKAHAGAASGASGGKTAAHGSKASALPPGVYFQPVQTGIFGSQTVQVTKGLHPGEQILLAPPSSLSTKGGKGFGGGGPHHPIL